MFDMWNLIKIKWGPNLLQMDTEDIVAIAAAILCIGGVLASLVVAVGLAFGKVQGSVAEKIILGCVGGSLACGVLTAILKKRRVKRSTRK